MAEALKIWPAKMVFGAEKLSQAEKRSTLSVRAVADQHNGVVVVVDAAADAAVFAVDH